jgi:hypothetical protein
MAAKLDFVLTHFSDSREYLADGYYRVKDFGDGIYELEFSVAGYCGTFDSKPAIKFQVLSESSEVHFLLYRDMTTQPVQFFTPDATNLDFVTAAFEKLVDQFYQVKAN